MKIIVNGLPCDICGGARRHLENCTYTPFSKGNAVAKTAEKFRKLSTSELEQLGLSTRKNTERQNQVKQWVEKYYPNSAAKAVVVVDSEYNDSTYDNSIKTIIVFDKNGNEIAPKAGMSLKARENLPDICLGDNNGYDSYNSTIEPLENIHITLTPQDLELYVKETE